MRPGSSTARQDGLSLPTDIPLTAEEASARLAAIVAAIDDCTACQPGAQAAKLELELVLDTLAEVRAIAARTTGWRHTDVEPTPLRRT